MQRFTLLSGRTAYQAKGLPTSDWLNALTGALIILVMTYPTIRHLA